MNDCRVPQQLSLWNINLLTVAAASGPGGGTRFAYALTEPMSTGEFYLDWFFTYPLGQLMPRIGTFAISALFKANGRSWAWLDAGDGDVDRYAYFDIENGVQGATSGADVRSTIEDVGDGWYRCTMYSVSQLSEEYSLPDNTTVSMGPANEDDGFGYAGNGTGVFVADVQFSAPGDEYIAPPPP